MKITRIEMTHFRGFPKPDVYTFDLPGSKNLLLYSENGSRKSSLYHALNQLFNIEVKPPAFSATLFGKDEKDKNVTDGRVTVHLDKLEVGWPHALGSPDHPLPPQRDAEGGAAAAPAGGSSGETAPLQNELNGRTSVPSKRAGT